MRQPFQTVTRPVQPSPAAVHRARRGAALLLILALAGCAAKPVAPPQSVGLRNPTAPVASQVDVTGARLAGDWVVVQGAGVAPGTRIRIADDRLTLDGVGGPFTPRGAGRYDTADGPLWVHWLDGGDRTAAVGDPSGRRVWIMDRTATASPDRIAAAREILDWYGYRVAQFDRIAP